MAAVPVIIHGVFMPSGKEGRRGDDEPIKGTMIGYATIQGLEVGGGPMPGGPDDAHPTHPIVIPDPPPDIPPDPPEQPQPGLAVVIKPAPVTGGWGLATKDQQLQWFFVPGQSSAGPKRR